MGHTGPTGSAGKVGATGPTGPTGVTCGGDQALMTGHLGVIDTGIGYNEAGVNNEAFGALIFNDSTGRMVTQMSAYVVRDGSLSGTFQMAILVPTSDSTAQVVASTIVATTITAGVFTLPLNDPYMLMPGAQYYLAVYNQVNGSETAAITAGIATAMNAPPINFRAQNLSGFTMGNSINTSDASVRKTPWLAVRV